MAGPRIIIPDTIEFHGGPMFSKKSDVFFSLDDSVKRISRYKIKNFKPDTDTTREGIYSRFRDKELPATTIRASHPEDILKHVDISIDAVCIDEIQFFSPELRFVLEKLRDNHLYVLVAGLTSDWRRQPFETVKEVLSTPGLEIITHYAICNTCDEPASYTQQLEEDEPSVYSEEQVAVDEDRLIDTSKKRTKITYQARCRKHHELPGIPEGYKY